MAAEKKNAATSFSMDDCARTTACLQQITALTGEKHRDRLPQPFTAPGFQPDGSASPLRGNGGD